MAVDEHILFQEEEEDENLITVLKNLLENFDPTSDLS